MGWFDFLEKQGYFNPANNPEPVTVEDGIKIPYWESLNYLEKLSMEIKDGKNLEYIDKIIQIIKDVSEHPKDNYRTWVSFIRIINHLPNDKTPIEIFDYIPVWLSGNFDTLSQSSELCEKTIPKFLNENPTKEDIKKVEKILRYLFQVHKLDSKKRPTQVWEHTHYSRVYLYFLTDILLEKGYIQKVAKFCSKKLIIYLADNLNKIYFDFPENHPIKINGKEEDISLIVNISNQTLIGNIQIENKKGEKNELVIDKITSKKEIKKAIEEKLKKEYGIDILNEDNSRGINWIVARIFNGIYHSFSGQSISKIHDVYFRGDKLEDTFCYIFRDYINAFVKSKPEDGLTLLKTIVYEQKYRLAFFQKVLYYVISENWEICSSLFFTIINDKSEIFSNYFIQDELYELLKKNQQNLKKGELELIDSIIDNGPNNYEEFDSKQPEKWKLKWYSALKDTDKFKAKYNTLSVKLNISFQAFEESREPRFMPTNISPINIDEILEKSNQEIVDSILSFRPKDTWEEPSINGFANAIEKAVENNPEKFAEEIHLYNNIFYIYCYHLLNGFQNAWNNRKQFNWRKVISFCDSYISSKKFTSNKLVLENDSWRANKDWVVGSVAKLLSSGMRSDAHAFSLDLLADAKAVLIKLTNEIKPEQFNSKNNLDYPTHFLNSVEGKVLGALLDYSLRRARNILPEQVRWEEDVKAVFDKAVNNKIIDVHIITGMYYPQFLYLDKEWLLNRIKENESLELDLWNGFVGGLEFANPPNKEIYELALPQYKNAINLINGNHVKLIRHIVAFYFWGFETHDGDGLVNFILTKSDNLQIQSLVNEMVIQKEYKNFLTPEDKILFENKIFSFWTFLVNKYSEASSKEELQTLAHFADLMVFIPELKDKYTDLIIKSTSLYEKYYHHTHYLLEKLLGYSKNSNTDETAQGIAKILNSIPFEEYLLGIDHDSIKTLVIYLFENKQQVAANEICNKITRHGDDFLKEVYNRYNS